MGLFSEKQLLWNPMDASHIDAWAFVDRDVREGGGPKIRRAGESFARRRNSPTMINRRQSMSSRKSNNVVRASVWTERRATTNRQCA
jgi:hypothetical protein